MSTTVSELWTQAFIAALHRLPVDQSVEEASKATEACIAYWHSQRTDLVPVWRYRKDLTITDIQNPEHAKDFPASTAKLAVGSQSLGEPSTPTGMRDQE